jgi:electron transport complex protein RnfC
MADRKELTYDCAISKVPTPSRVVLPVKQHIGAPARVVVQKGDVVQKGQLIAESGGRISANVCASVSGTVVDVSLQPHCSGRDVLAVVIETGEEQGWKTDLQPMSLAEAKPDEIISIIEKAGIVGMGGAGFPTHIKLMPPREKKIDALVINGCECEPYLTADYRLMIEYPKEVIFGVRALAKALGVNQVFIGIEDNKPAALSALQEVNDGSLRIVPLKTKYPQGAEKQLIFSILKREVPTGCLPMDVGVVVNNVGTAYAVWQAIARGWPLVERVVTVSGEGVARPGNYLVPLGMSVGDLIEACLGFVGQPGKVILGGPMMGIAITDLSVPVIKGTSGIVVLNRKQARKEAVQPCIKCGRCVEVCPTFLLPSLIARFAEHDEFDSAEEYGAMNCIECGSCSFVCPAKRPLVHWIQMAKAQLSLKRQKVG